MNLDHVNIRVQNLEKMCEFYTQVLGLKLGYRPPFSGAAGAWLYDIAEHPVVHLSSRSSGGDRSGQNLDHIAFRTDDLASIIERLDSYGIEFQADEVPETKLKQIFFEDPEGGKVEVNYVVVK